MKSKIRLLTICGLFLLVTGMIPHQHASAFWGRTWNGHCGVPCAGPACYPAFRPFGGLLQCAFCHIFPCRCHTWNACPPVNPCYDPCYVTFRYSDYCCDTGVLIDQSVGNYVPDRVIPGPQAGSVQNSNRQGPNVRPDSLNKGNFNTPTLTPPTPPSSNAPQFRSMHSNPAPETSVPNTSSQNQSSYGYGSSGATGSGYNTTPSGRTPSTAVQEVITSDYDEIADPASSAPALPSDSMPGFGGGYNPDTPFATPSTGGGNTPPLPPAPPAPGSGGGASKINLGTGTISINVPENAKVYINGYETKQTGTQRTYVSNDLIPGQDYRYEIHVVANVGGQWLEETKHMLLTAEEHALLSFSTFDNARPAFPSMNLQLTARAK